MAKLKSYTFIGILLLLSTFLTGILDSSRRLQAQQEGELPPFPTSTPSATPEPLAPFPTSTPTSLPVIAAADSTNRLLLTCHAEPKWDQVLNIRRGPSASGWGVLNQFKRNAENYEMWVIGRNEENTWFQVVLPAPYAGVIGWVWREGINLYGVCDGLPITPAVDSTTITAPPVPETAPMPAFAQGIALQPTDRAFLVKPGILYVRRDTAGLSHADEMLEAHILVMDLTHPQLEVSVQLGAVPDVGGMVLSEMAMMAGAFAAINGDYYASNFMPQNLTIIDGQVVSAPKHRAAFALTAAQQPHIGYFTEGWTWDASVIAANGQAITMQLMNLPCDPLWLCLYSHHLNGRLPSRYGGVRVFLDSQFKVLDIVEDQAIDIPEGYFVLRGGDVTGQWLRDNIQVGDQIQVNTPTTPDWRSFETAIGGGPRILVDGAFWQDCDPNMPQATCEEFDEDFRNHHYYNSSIPRTAIGYSQDGTRLIAIMVEGYEVEDSRGATQRELAEMFLDFGAYQAMEFDGGGSSSMWMRPGGIISDLGSKGERRVSNALVFLWHE